MTVAPRAGAWIETIPTVNGFITQPSRPVRARGLKQIHMQNRPRHFHIVPRAGAWISYLDKAPPFVVLCITKGGAVMTISLRLNEKDTLLIKKYAELKRVSVSELIRQTVLERIEDEYDLKAYEKAMEEYQANPVAYSHDEVRKLLELD